MQDLWADFAGELRSEGEAGPRQRRPTDQAVLAALRAWLLQDYMLPYGTSLGATRIFKRCYWIDGLGNTRGPAPSADAPDPAREVAVSKRDRRGGQTPALPPALEMAEIVARHLGRLERPITLRSFALEERRGKRKSASASQNGTGAPLTLPKEGGTLSGSWPELAPTLLPALEGCAAVFLLNPLKHDLFRYADLPPLYGRASPTELFLWLPHKQIEALLLPALRTGQGAATLTNLLRGDRWKTLLTKSEEHPE